VVSGQLEDSLRHEIESYIEGRIGGIKQEIAALQSQLNESLTRLMDRQGEVQLDGGVAASILDHLRAAHEEGIDLAASESSRAKASSDMAIVKAAISEIEEQQSQADILKILVNRASAFAPRVVFFVVKGGQSVGWRARGFQGTVGDNAIHQLSFPIGADTPVGSAIRSRETWSGGPGSHSENHLILNRFGDDPPARIVAVPLVVRNRTVAVLYADSAGLDSEAINLEALETLVHVAGMAVDLLAARSAPARESTAPAPKLEEVPAEEVRRPEPQAYTPIAEYDEITPVVEESAPAAEVHEVREAVPEQIEVAPERFGIERGQFVAPARLATETEQFVALPEPEQIVATPETRPEPFEAPPTFADVPVEMTSPPGVSEAIDSTATPRRRYGTEVELPVEVANEEERRLHNDARRFARLLVSEIKLYNEQKVTEGRSQYDLYVRLRDYIDRSREMYDKRVKPEVAQRYDYFHQELVNTLAEGDAARMGSAYPGAKGSA
jgi:GAF domain-containing protein